MRGDCVQRSFRTVEECEAYQREQARKAAVEKPKRPSRKVKYKVIATGHKSVLKG